MKITVLANYASLSEVAAKHVAGYIVSNPGKLLCFAAGDTPMGMFSSLIRQQKEGTVDLSSMWYAGLDEWVGLGYEDPGSCRQVMFDSFYTPAGILSERIRTFNGKAENLDCERDRMDEWVAEKGGIGLAVLGIGMNGHLGFNEPGASLSDQSVVMTLDSTTLHIGRKYFNGNRTPGMGISLGLGQLMKAGSVVLLADGEKKADIVRAALKGDVTDGIPASYLQRHPDCTCFLDEGAALKLAQ